VAIVLQEFSGATRCSRALSYGVYESGGILWPKEEPCTVTDLTALNGATIAFDLDGTLVESAPDLIGAVNAILIGEGFKPLAYDEGRPFISRGARWLLQWGLEIAGEQEPAARTAALFGRFISYYSAHIADESLPFPGAIDALKTLKAAGAKLVICTNKPTDLSRSLLTKLDMVGLFAGVVGID